MIKQENKRIGARDFVYTYSDLSVYIQNENGDVFENVYDLTGHPHTYTETDEKIQPDEEELVI